MSQAGVSGGPVCMYVCVGCIDVSQAGVSGGPDNVCPIV